MSSEILNAFKVLNDLEKLCFVNNKYKQTSNRKLKKNILTKNKNNKILKDIFNKTFGDNAYNIADKTLNKITPFENNRKSNFESSWFDFVELLQELKEKKLSGNDAIKTLRYYFGNIYGQEESKWYLRILKHNLKLGLSSTTMHNVWPKDLI